MPFARPRPFHVAMIAAALAGAASAGLAIAQSDSTPAAVEPVSSGASFEVNDIDVDVSARDGQAAREQGYRLAQRKAWALLFARMTGKPASAAPAISDNALDGLVSGIVVEHENVGPTRYVAELGVLFDRGRTGQLLGVKGQVLRSPPMLMIPVLIDGGAAQTVETRNPWMKAWARFRAGASPIEYVRPTGTGPDPLLLNYGQTRRPDRSSWMNLLDQYGASDVLVAEAKLGREYPGGPVIGRFVARHGPDNLVIARFALKTGASGGLDAMLDEAVKRIDDAYAAALRDGRLKPDPSLRFEDLTSIDLSADLAPAVTTENLSALDVTVETPDSAAVSAIESSMRQVSGVSNTLITSLSLGGLSRMQISYSGDFATLRWALDQRGWRLDEAGGSYRLRRRKDGEPPIARPAPPPVADDVVEQAPVPPAGAPSGR